MTVVHALGALWGAIAALPVVRLSRRAALGERRRELRRPPRIERARSKLVARARRLWPEAGSRPGPVAQLVATVRERRRRARDARALERELPVVLDLLAVAVDAGCTPYLAVETAAQWSPPVAAGHLARVVAACRLGETFVGALDAAARREPRLGSMTAALLASERSGAPVRPALGRLADEQRAAVRRRAEAHARRVPVRLLFPLVLLVLPAFGLMTVVPALLAGLDRL